MSNVVWTDSQALAYIASYADLRRAFGANPAAGRDHYARAGMAEGRTVTFDALAYTASYADLIRAFGTDTAASARHFIVAGAAEGRTASFDALSYTASYPDLIRAFGADTAAATRHYIAAGAAEGRTASFDALSYIASYPDLVRAFGTDTAAGTRHYIVAGAAEGRTASFDALGYVASYPDLIAAFGFDAVAATRHFIAAGLSEGRSVSFDALAYTASYPDLIRAFGTDTAAATRHFIAQGAREGRSASFDAVNYLFSQPDLLAAGFTAAGAARHWINGGVNEQRNPTSAFGADQVGHALPLGATTAGEIGSAGDRDWFRIDLTAGKGVSFDFFPSNGNGVVAIHDDAGRRLTPSEVAGARTSFLAARTGTYYVVVSTANNATGTYTLTANDFLTFTGTSGADTLSGTDGADAIRGLDGADTLAGRGGNDLLEGGGGYDTLNGGLGDDILYGNNAANTGFDLGDFLGDDLGGNDQLFGQDGDDSLNVSRFAVIGTSGVAASTVLLDGGNGNDSLYFSSSRFLDTVTLRGGAGNDTIGVGPVLKSVIDAGDGNDRVTIGMSGGDQTITLGSGSDVLTLDGFVSVFAIGNPVRITDFQIGVDTLVFDKYLGATLQGWDRVTNPFGTGHLRLVQSSGDTLLQLDRDGAGSSYGFGTLLTFGNTVAAALTAQDIGYAPDGSAAVGQTITGTGGTDNLTGTDGADVIRGLGGGDVINGRGGADTMEGGEGYDQLDGGLGDDVLYGNNAINFGVDFGDSLNDDQGGDDRLFGQDGDDYLSVSRYTFNGNIAASTVLLDGGNGNDVLNFSAINRFLDTVTVRGGPGNDTISIGPVFRSVIDAGDGNDRVTIGMTGGDQTITLGSGTDVLTLDGFASSFAIGNPTRIVDFQIGIDTLNFDRYLGWALLGWDKVTNPFATGHLKLIQSGSDTLLQLDRDGAGTGYAFDTLLTFGNTAAAALTAPDIGFAPDGSAPVGRTITGTAGADALTGTDAADVIRGLEGGDTLRGRAGNDVLEGGDGYDQLDGGFGDDLLYGNNAANTGGDGSDSLIDDQGGNDQLFGQEGDDYINVSRYGFNGNGTTNIAASSVLLDGGNGNDSIYFGANSRFLDTVTVRGGAGNDTISIGSVFRSLIDAGEGNDKISINMSGGDQTITLGTGADVLTLEGLGQIFAIGNPVRITDFQIGTDTLSFDQYLSAILLGWDRVGNPFASGYLKLVQSGSDTLLQLDRDGAGTSYAFDTLLTFGNTVATAFTAKDLGYSPLVAMNMAPNAFAADVYSIQHEMPDTSTYLLI